MLTFLTFIHFEMNTAATVAMYHDRKSCGDDMDAKVSLYYPDGMPREIYVVCNPSDIIGTSQIPKLRGLNK